jgi:hypothetical protein
MRRFSLIGVTLLAAFALGAVMASSAFALPEISKAGKWTGKSTSEPTLELLGGGLTTIKCKEAEGSGEDTSKMLGTFTIDFKSNCAAGGGLVKCNSLGDAAGVILSGGTYHYVDDVLTTLAIAILFLPESVHLECGATLILVHGSLLCLVLEPGSSKTSHEFHCEKEGAGDQKERTYWDDSGTAQTAQLLCAVNEGALESCAEVALASVTYKEAVSISV